MIGSNSDLALRGRPSDLRRRHHAGQRRHRVVERRVKRNRRVVSSIGVEIGVPVDGPFPVCAALKRTRAVLIEWNRRSCLLRGPAAGAKRENGERERQSTQHSSMLARANHGADDNSDCGPEYDRRPRVNRIRGRAADVDARIAADARGRAVTLRRSPSRRHSRGIGRRVQDRREEPFENEVLAPCGKRITSAPRAVSLLHVPQRFAQVLIFTRQRPQSRGGRLVPAECAVRAAESSWVASKRDQNMPIPGSYN